MKKDDLKLPVLFGGISFSSRTDNKENMVSIIGDCFLEVTSPILDYMDMRVIFECMRDFQEKSNNGWAIENDPELLRDSANEYLLENKNKFLECYRSIVDKKKETLKGEWSEEMSKLASDEARKIILAPFFYFGETLNQVYIKEFDVMDILERSEVEKSSSQRSLILESIKKLSALTLNWYVPSDKMKKKMEDIKRGRLFYEYNPLLIELWKNNPKEFDVHFRTFINSASLTNNHNHVKIGINKGFIDLANKNGRTIDCSQLNKLGSNISKSLMVRLSMMKKNRVHLETIYEMLLLKKDAPSKSKKRHLKVALDRLIEIDFLSSYEIEDKFVNLKYKNTAEAEKIESK